MTYSHVTYGILLFYEEAGYWVVKLIWVMKQTFINVTQNDALHNKES